jgi:hypothetical protein
VVEAVAKVLKDQLMAEAVEPVDLYMQNVQV